MSFARTVKEELVTIPVSVTEQLAEFSAFINLNSEFHIESKLKMLDFKSNNPTVSKRFLQLVRTLYQAETSLLTKKVNKLNQRQSIIVRIESKVENIVKEHDLLDKPNEKQEFMTESIDAKKAFLRAAFLVGGSINHPKTAEYHLEIFARDSNQVVFLQSLLNHFELNAKILQRRNGYICYIKDAEGISDFLQIIGAQNSLFQFEDIRIKRDFNNSINRIMNCEIANEKKAIVAANKQILDIELIMNYATSTEVDKKIKKVMDLRLENPDLSLIELVLKYEEKYEETISKSGLNHRFVKIKQLAEMIKERRS